MKTKKIGILSLILILVTLVTVTGAVFAYYMSAESGWTQQINVTSVNFYLNGNAQGSTVTPEDLGNFSKGTAKELALTFNARSTANVNSEANYTFSFSLDADADNSLAPAVEVYIYRDGEYEFLCRLSDIASVGGLTGVCAVELGENNFLSVTHKFKLVYSAAAGDGYEGKSFSLSAVAYCEIDKNASDRYFVRNFSDLENAVLNASAKTITLLKDIVLEKDIVFTTKTSLDLYGNNVILNGHKLDFRYPEAGGPDDKKALFDSSTASGGIYTDTAKTAAGKVSFSCFADAPYIQDDLSSYAEINLYSAKALAKKITEECAAAENKIISAAETIDVMKGLKAYAGKASISLSAALDAVLVFSNGEISAKAEAVKPVTLSYGGYLSVDNEASALLNIRIGGNGSAAVAAKYLEQIPEKIYSSLFLPVSDQAYGADLEWYTSDENVLSGDGVLMPLGADSLNKWDDKHLKIGVTANMSGTQYAVSKTVSVVLMDSAERTDRLYYGDKFVFDTDGQTVALKDILNSEIVRKTVLTKVTATIDDKQNTDNGNNKYISLRYENNLPVFVLVNRPLSQQTLEIDVELTFTYGNGEVDSTFTVNTKLVLLNKKGDAQLEDITADLQRGFSDNDYIAKLGVFDFYVKGSVSSGIGVEYSCASNFVFIENEVFLKDVGGSFYRTADGWVYFSGRYSKNADLNYVLDAAGAYIKVNDGYFLYEEVKNDIYSEYAHVTVLPAAVPNDNVSVTVDARLFTYENGEKVYKKDADGADLSYTFTFDVYGVYHNGAAEIADVNLYNKLVSYYDLNGNGWIEVYEAQSDWFGSDGSLLLKSALAQKTGTYGNYSYMDFSDSFISDLKGLEYFTGIMGLDFSGNAITEIGALAELYELLYIDASNNSFAGLEALTYLDKLTYLDLSYGSATASNYGKISDVGVLGYLTRLVYVNLNGNNAVADFSSLSELTSLKYVDIRQTNDANTNKTSVIYDMLLVIANNRQNRVSVYRSTVESGTMSYTDAEIAAAKALSEFMVSDNVYVYLNFPSVYKYTYTVGSVTYSYTYDLYWETLDTSDRKYFDFTYDTAGNAVGYVIDSPVVNRMVEIGVKVREQGDAGEWLRMERACNFTLLKNPSEEIYIEISAGEVKRASLAVPDGVLLSELFDKYNRVTEGTYTVNGVTYNEIKILTYSEISNPTEKFDLVLDNMNVTSLEGLNYFGGALEGKLLSLKSVTLSDADMAVISRLSGLGSLALSGQKYDFDIFTHAAGSSFNSVFTDLKQLSVVGSYSANDEKVLAGLYKMYLANANLDIYKDSDTEVWDPYADIAKYAQNLRFVFPFMRLNDSYDLSDAFVINFYGVKEIAFSASSFKFYGRMTGSGSTTFAASQFFETVTENGAVTTLRYKKLVPYDETFYASVNLAGNDGRGDIFCERYLQLLCEFNHGIRVADIVLNGRPQPLDVVFPGRSLRGSVVNALTSAVFNKTAASGMDAIGSGWYADAEGYIYITKATLASLNVTSVTIDGMHNDEGLALTGLKYLTRVTSAVIERDVNLGDGSELVNLTKLTAYYSGVDFSSLTVSLPKLTVLILGDTTYGTSSKNCRYVNLTDGTIYYLAQFPNLAELDLINCNISSWEGLKGLIGNTSFATLRIFATNQTYTNLNTNIEKTVNIISSIWQSSTAAEKKFYIGSPTDATDKTYLYDGLWTDFGGATKWDPLALEEYKEFAPLVLDAGLKAGGEYYYRTHDDIVTAGETIELPGTVSELFFGTNYKGGNYFTRDFSVDWRIAGMSAANAEEIFGLAATDYTVAAITGTGTNIPFFVDLNHAKNGYALTVKGIPADFYFVITGVIGKGYYDAGGNYTNFAQDSTKLYGFVYPILIKGATESAPAVVNGKTYETYSYAIFDDPVLRYLMFCSIGSFGVDNLSIYASKYYNFGSILKIATDSTPQSETGMKKITGLGIYSDHLSVNASAGGSGYISVNRLFDYAGWGNPSITELQKGLISLKGLEQLESIESLTVERQYIADINALAPTGTEKICSTLTSLSLVDNTLSDVSALRHFTSLQKIDFSGNALTKLTFEGKSVFAASAGSIKSLNLLGNKGINGSEIAAFAETFPSGNDLTTLSLYNTSCSGDASTVEALEKLLNKDSDKTVNITLTSEKTSVLTYKDVAAFLYIIRESAALKDYINGSVVLSSFDNIKVDVTYDGSSYSATASLPPNFAAQSAKLGSKEMNVGLKVAVGSELSGVYYVRFVNSGAVNYGLTVGGVTYGPEDFDPSLWAYLISTLSAGSDGNFPFKATSININKDFGLRTLKGLDLLTTLYSVTVSNNPTLTSLWEGEFPSLVNLTVSSATLSAQQMSVLAYCPKLAYVILNQSYGIDYFETVTLKDGSTTTLAKIMSTKPNLASFSINGSDIAKWYPDSHSLFEILNNIYKADGTLFNVAGGKQISSFNWLTLFPVNSGKYTYAALTASNIETAMRTEYWLTNAGTRKLLYLVTDNTSNIIKYASNIAGSARSDLLPKELSQADLVSETGVRFYLPTSFTYLGKTINLTWTTAENASWIDDATNSLFINKNNYVDEQTVTLNLTASCDNLTLGTTSFTYEITVREAPTEQEPLYKEPVYFLMTADGAGSKTYTPAANVIESPNLIFWLFNESGFGVEKCTVDGVNGWALDVAAVTSIDADNRGFTSLKGVETFPNLTEIRIGPSASGHITDLSPLSDVALTKFIYSNSQYPYLYIAVEDFSPLVEGSRDTLTEFSYATRGNVEVSDLSFLTEFKQLKRVYLATSVTDGATFVEYMHSPSFKYLIAYFNQFRPDTSVLVSNSLKNLPFDTEQVKINNVTYKKLIADKDTLKASRILSSYAGGGDVTLTGISSLTLTGGQLSADGKVSFALPGLIDFGGSLYPAVYRSASANISIFETYTVKLTKPVTLTDGTVVNNGDIITYRQAKELVSNFAFVSQRLEGNAELTVLAILSDRDYYQKTALGLTVSAEVDGFMYERTLYLYGKATVQTTSNVNELRYIYVKLREN